MREFAALYVDLARWRYQPAFFKKKTFREFVEFGGSKASKAAIGSPKLAELRSRFEENFWENSRKAA